MRLAAWNGLLPLQMAVVPTILLVIVMVVAWNEVL